MSEKSILNTFCLSEEEVQEKGCSVCGGTGYVGEIEFVWAGEPHMAEIGEKRCYLCNSKEEKDAEGLEGANIEN